METIDITLVLKKMWNKKKLFFIVWIVVFALSVLWIMPQPRYYSCSVSLAPETGGDNMGGINSIASSFGLNLGIQGNDAIHPLLYPELMESPDFLVELFPIQIKTINDSIHCDYATYLRKYQKKNWLKAPFISTIKSVTNLFTTEESEIVKTKGKKINAFNLSKKDYDLMKTIGEKITCAIDQKTEVITITVQDQDRLVCALMADSARQHLEDFIIQYRTKKAKIDVLHYQSLADKAKKEYDKTVVRYSSFCDANQDVNMQSLLSERDQLENEMQMKYNTYSAMQTQLEAMKVKLQEKTPAFTTLQSATVPQKPAGPKRMLFIVMMLIIATMVTSCVVLKNEMHKLLIFYKK